MTAWVTPYVSIRSCSSVPPSTFAGVTTSSAPEEPAISHSSTDGSKLGAHTCNTRDRSVTPYSSTLSCTSAASPWWVTATPFGRPVDPEV